MSENKNLMRVKEGFFISIINKIKGLFIKEPQNLPEEKLVTCQKQTTDRKNEFLSSIRVQENSDIIYLKMKLENNEIKAIDLTEEQIDELQKIYDKEIFEKQNKIKKLKGDCISV